MAKIDQALRAVEAQKKPTTPAQILAELIPLVRKFEPMAELDFSFYTDAITICDMSAPNALRYGILYTRFDLDDDLHKKSGELERRVNAFMKGD
jgi:hypothetical protein